MTTPNSLTWMVSLMRRVVIETDDIQRIFDERPERLPHETAELLDKPQLRLENVPERAKCWKYFLSTLWSFAMDVSSLYGAALDRPVSSAGDLQRQSRIVNSLNELGPCHEELIESAHEILGELLDAEKQQMARFRREGEECRRRCSIRCARKDEIQLEIDRDTMFGPMAYLGGHHSLVYNRLALQKRDGGVTEPPHKMRSTLCPAELKPWTRFIEEQRRCLGELVDKDPYFLYNYQYGEFSAMRKDLGPRLKSLSEDTDRSSVKLFYGITEPAVNFFGRSSRKCMRYVPRFLIPPYAISSVPVAKSEDKKGWPEVVEKTWQQVYFLRASRSKKTLATFYDFQHPKKLTAAILRAGLHGPLKIRPDGSSQVAIEKVPDDEFSTQPVSRAETQFRHRAARLTLAALAPSYQFMLSNGLSYGMVTTMETFVFLHVDWSQPQTLYYHLAEPLSEAEMYGSHCSALAQLSAFLFQAWEKCRVDVIKWEDRVRAVEGAIPWDVDFMTELSDLPPYLLVPPIGSSACRPSLDPLVERKPITTWGESDPESEPRVDGKNSVDQKTDSSSKRKLSEDGDGDGQDEETKKKKQKVEG
ncbi:hypothetical protein CP532_3946 [Ophiocordyceps camponoti-leonardi (nom. inval.)]|nr:hypothetical protein CP532_3946 [Ophiocordyceps camponoti-leonardi (nom. inval.)]